MREHDGRVPPDEAGTERLEAALCLALFACLAVLMGQLPFPALSDSWPRPYDAGESWLYPALSGEFDNYWFPFLPVTLALVKYHLPEWAAGAARILFFLPLTMLSFSAASLIHSRRAGVISASLTLAVFYLIAVEGRVPYAKLAEQALIASALLVFLSADSAWPKRGIRAGLARGLAFSAAIWAKGITAPLPLLFLLLKSREKRSLRAALRVHWPVLAVPAAALLCWGAVNVARGGEFILLEGSSRAGSNMVVGALGFVNTVEGDWRAAAGIPEGGNLVLWTMAETAAHPLRFLLGVQGRLEALLFKAPLVPGLWVLFLLGCAAAFRLAKREKARPALLVAGYMLGIHLLMPVEGRYLVPFWLLLSCLLGIAAADLFRRKGSASDVTNGKAVLLAAGVPLMAIWAFSFILMVAFPLRGRLPPGGRASGTGSPWAQAILAERAMAGGDLDGALAGYRRARELDDNLWRRADEARASLIHGGVPAREIEALAREPGGEYLAMFAAGLKYLEEGRAGKAGVILPAALENCVEKENSMRNASTAGEADFVARLRDGGAGRCVSKIGLLAELLPDRRRDRIEKGLSAACPACVPPPGR